MATKKIIYALLFICSLCGCSEKDIKNVPSSIEVSAETVDFLSGSSSQTVTVTVTGADEYTYAVDEAGSSWCSASGDGGKLTITVTENTGEELREATVTVAAGNLSKRITVRQQGRGASILVSPRQLTLPAIGAEVELTVTANVAFSVTGVPSWMSAMASPPSAAGAVSTLRYRVAPNTSAAQRSATIAVRDAASGSACGDSALLVQEGSGGSASTGIGPDVKIAVSGGEASSHHSGEEIGKSYDGSYATIYHSDWSGTTYPLTLTYNLTEADALDYLIYHPRQSGHNGLFREVEILAKYEGAADFAKVKDFDFNGAATATRVNFEPALKNVAAVRFVVKSSVSDDGMAFASCAEMEFYKKNPDNFDPLTLFSDRSCSSLKSGITMQEVEACSNAFFRGIATHMYNNVYPREFRIAEYRAYPDPAEDAAVNKTSRYSKYDNPTGIAVEAGDTLVALVDGVQEGYPVSVKIQDLDGEAAGQSYFDQGASYPLANGVNQIIAGNKGLVYVMYFRTDYAAAPKLKVHFATGTVNGYFDVEKHATTAEWTRLLGAASHKFFDVVGRNAHLTFPTESYRQHTGDRGVELINLYDRLMQLEWEFMGLLPEPNGYGKTANSQPFRNRMYFVVMYGDNFMNATSYRTAYNVGTMSTVCNVAALLNENGNGRDAIWGPAHEVGHVNQTQPGFKWHGMTEVTNNLHSIYVQTRLHANYNPLVNTRLQMESMRGEGGYVNRYEKAMNVYVAGRKPHNYIDSDLNGNGMDVFCKLVPFWQLHLYLTEVRGITGKGGKSFYADIYQEVRKAPGDGKSDGEHQLAFVERVCDKAQLNLEDFFRAYGFFVPMSVVIDDYGKKTVTVAQATIDATLSHIRNGKPKPLNGTAIQYITDENVETFKSGSGVVAYELREGSETGAVTRVYLNTTKPETLNPASITVPAGQKLYSVDVSGSRTFIR
jgi:hypothetical protein